MYERYCERTGTHGVALIPDSLFMPSPCFSVFVGFHPHNNADQLFEQSGHVTLEPYGDANIIDLR